MNEPPTAGAGLDAPVVVARPRSAAPRFVRIWAGVVFAACAAVLGVAVWLHPDPRGFGTHQQLGSGPCGMLIYTGYPCPTCGMTTAFAHAVRGQWRAAFWAQPGGLVLALATGAALVLAGAALVVGRWPLAPVHRLRAFHLFTALLVVLVGGWAFKIAVGLARHTLPYR